jgi:hypothetical protein
MLNKLNFLAWYVHQHISKIILVSGKTVILLGYDPAFPLIIKVELLTA